MPILVKEVVVVTSIIAGVGGLLAMISLLALTVNKDVAQDELMVAINTKYTGEVRGPFEQGRHNLHVGDSMVTFARTVRPMQFRLTCFSSDQLQVTLEMTVMYQYEKDAIIPTILRTFYDETYLLGIVRPNVVSSALVTCSNFTAEEYYVTRQKAENALLSNLKIDLETAFVETIPEFVIGGLTNTSMLPLRITQLQLTNIEFPRAYNDIIQRKLQMQVQQTASLNSRATALTAANTVLIAIRQQANIVVINGNQIAETIMAQANATQQIVLDQWKARALSFQAVQSNLGFTEDQTLLEYWQAEPLRVMPRSFVALP